MESMAEWVWVLIPLGVIGLGALSIYFDHKKRMAMIAKGMNPDKEKREAWKRGKLTGGLVMMGIGAAFLVTAITIWTEAIPQLYLLGLVCGFIGIALVISYGIEPRK